MNNVQLFRQAMGLSKGELAEATGLSESQIGRIEKGESDPTLETARKIAAALHVVQLDYLFPDKQKAAS